MAKLFTVTETVQVGMEVKGEYVCGHPLSPGLLRLLQRACADMKCPMSRLITADFEEGEGADRWMLEKDAADKRAIVYLHIGHFDGVVTSLLASTKQEELIDKPARVLRKYKPFEEAIGCDLLLEQELQNPNGSLRAKEYLIEMQPGAAFIVHRTGALEGAPGLLTIRWEGRWNMRGVKHQLDVLEASRFSLFVHGGHHNKKHQVRGPRLSEAMPSFQAR